MSDIDVIIQVHTDGIKKVGDLSASLRNLTTTLRGISVPMSKLDTQSRAVNKALGITSRGVNDHAKSIKNLVQNQKVLSQEQRRIVKEVGLLKNAYALAGRETTQLGRNIGVTTRELQSFSRSLKSLRMRAFGSDIYNVSLRLSKMGKDAQFVGRSLLINLTLPLATFARVGLQSFRALDQEMTRLVKVSENLAASLDVAYQKMGILGKATAEQQVRAEQMVESFERLNYRLGTLSLKFGVAREMVTSIAADFAELGITSEENTEKLTTMTLQIEKLGNMDIGPAQDLSTALYFQSRRALEVNGALDKLTSARQRELAAINAAKAQMLLFNSIENATALTLRDLGDAFPEVASAATSFGLSMTEAAAMLAPMKAAGLDVGASANSIKVSLQRLIAPTKQNTDMLNKLAERYGVANDAQSEFTLSTKTGLIGLDATVKMFNRVRSSTAGMEGALRLMSDLFEKRQGPRMYLAIEQLADFNNELARTEDFANKTLPATASAEIQMARVADEAAKKFAGFNNNITPKTIRSFKDIGNIARIATAQVGQRIQIEPGEEVRISASDIAQAKAMRAAVSDLILKKKQAEGIDLISEAKTEAGRAMLVELAGAANAQIIAQQELDRSLETVGVQVDRIKIAFKQFAAEIVKRLKPAIEDIAERVVNFLKHWSSPEMKEARERIVNLVLALGSFLAAMGPVILAIGTFQSVVGNAGKGLSIIFPKLKNVQGEFIGIGRTAKMAATSIDDFYKKFIDKSSRGATPLVPKLPAGAGVSRPSVPFNRQKFIDDVVKDELAKTGATPNEIRKARRELRAGTSGRLTPKGTLVRGTRGRNLSMGASAALKVLEAAGEEGTRLSAVSGMATDPDFRRVYRRTRRTIDRARDISTISPYLEAAGVSTDEMGTRFLRGGREITERQARGLGRGGVSAIRARAGIAVGQTKDAITGAATAPIKAYKRAVDAAKASQAALIAQQTAFGQTPGRINKMISGVMGFVRSLKVARIAAMAFKTALMFTGIGVVIAGIAAVVFLVIKNLDKIKGAKKGWDALKAAFNLVKEAAMEIIRPIQDLFASFGSGKDEGEKAGNGIAQAFIGIAEAIKFVAGLFKVFVQKVVQPLLYGIVNIVMAVVSLFKGNWQDALKFLIAAFGALAKGVVNLFIGMAKGVIKIVVGIVNSILGIFAKIPGMGGVVKSIQGAVSKVGDGIVGIYDKVGNGITGLLDKAVDLGIKKSSNALVSKGKPKFEEAGGEIGEAGNEAITAALGNEDNVEDAAEKLANAIKDGVKDAAQKLYDYVVDRMGDAIKKFVTNTVKALNKQKESALKVFDVQINTLAKLEKAEESLTRKKEYEVNRRKMIDDATLRGEAYRRNRALAIYEGRIDDARILDLEEQQAAKDSQEELSNLDESRRRDLVKENLDALREAINNAKELAGKFFDESIEKFQQAAEHITRIAPVTIEQYTAQLAELQTLTTQTADTNNLEFGKMFEKFATTIAEKMPNAVDDFGNALGAFSEPLDELVLLAQSKYGLGSEDEATVLGVTRKMADSVIGITVGMLVDIGDKFSSNAEPIIEKYGEITGGVAGKAGEFKEDILGIFNTILEETKTKFLEPYKKALDEADPHTVFKNAIVDGNEEILRSFMKILELNPDLMKKIAASLDPAIKKYIALKAAADAAKDAMNNAGGANPEETISIFGDGFDRAETNRFMRIKDANKFIGPQVPKKPITVGSGFGTIQSYSKPGFFPQLYDQLGKVGAQDGLIDKLTRFDSSSLEMIEGGIQRVLGLIGFKEGGPVPSSSKLKTTSHGVSGFLNAPEQQGIPAILHGGEYVINADAVKRIGLGALAKLNDPRIPKFKKGGFVGTADQAERKALAAAKASAKSGRGSSTLPDAIDANIKRKQTILQEKKTQKELVSLVGTTNAKRLVERFEEPFAATKVIGQKKIELSKVNIQVSKAVKEIENLKQDAVGRKAVNSIVLAQKQIEKVNDLRQDATGRMAVQKLLTPPKPTTPTTPLGELMKGAGNTVMGAFRFAKGNITGNQELTERGASQLLGGLKGALNPTNLMMGLLVELPKEILMGLGRTLSGKNLIWGQNSVANVSGKMLGALLGNNPMPTKEELMLSGMGLLEDGMNIASIFTMGGTSLANPLATTSVKSMVKEGVSIQGEKFITSMVRATGDDLLEASVARTLSQGARGEISIEYAKELATNQVVDYYKGATGKAILENMYAISNPKIRQGALNIWAKLVGKETPRAAMPNMLTASKVFQAFDPKAAAQQIITKAEFISAAKGGQAALNAASPEVSKVVGRLLPGTLNEVKKKKVGGTFARRGLPPAELPSFPGREAFDSYTPDPDIVKIRSVNLQNQIGLDQGPMRPDAIFNFSAYPDPVTKAAKPGSYLELYNMQREGNPLTDLTSYLGIKNEPPEVAIGKIQKQTEAVSNYVHRGYRLMNLRLASLRNNSVSDYQIGGYDVSLPKTTIDGVAYDQTRADIETVLYDLITQKRVDELNSNLMSVINSYGINLPRQVPVWRGSEIPYDLLEEVSQLGAIMPSQFSSTSLKQDIGLRFSTILSRLSEGGEKTIQEITLPAGLKVAFLDAIHGTFGGEAEILLDPNTILRTLGYTTTQNQETGDILHILKQRAEMVGKAIQGPIEMGPIGSTEFTKLLQDFYNSMFPTSKTLAIPSKTGMPISGEFGGPVEITQAMRGIDLLNIIKSGMIDSKMPGVGGYIANQEILARFGTDPELTGFQGYNRVREAMESIDGVLRGNANYGYARYEDDFQTAAQYASLHMNNIEAGAFYSNPEAAAWANWQLELDKLLGEVFVNLIPRPNMTYTLGDSYGLYRSYVAGGPKNIFDSRPGEILGLPNFPAPFIPENINDIPLYGQLGMPGLGQYTEIQFPPTPLTPEYIKSITMLRRGEVWRDLTKGRVVNFDQLAQWEESIRAIPGMENYSLVNDPRFLDVRKLNPENFLRSETPGTMGWGSESWNYAGPQESLVMMREMMLKLKQMGIKVETGVVSAPTPRASRGRLKRDNNGYRSFYLDDVSLQDLTDDEFNRILLKYYQAIKKMQINQQRRAGKKDVYETFGDEFSEYTAIPMPATTGLPIPDVAIPNVPPKSVFKMDANLTDLMGGQFIPPGFSPDDLNTPLGRMIAMLETGMGRINRPGNINPIASTAYMAQIGEPIGGAVSPFKLGAPYLPKELTNPGVPFNPGVYDQFHYPVEAKLPISSQLANADIALGHGTAMPDVYKNVVKGIDMERTKYFVVKRVAERQQDDITKELAARSEVLASRLYSLFGMNTVRPQMLSNLFDDNGNFISNAIVSNYIPNLVPYETALQSQKTKGLYDLARMKFQSGGLIDAWLGNYDVIGYSANSANLAALLDPTGFIDKVIRTDVGGALGFSGTGKIKLPNIDDEATRLGLTTPSFGLYPQEFYQFFKTKASYVPQARAYDLFHDMSIERLLAEGDQLQLIATDKAIRENVNAVLAGSPDDAENITNILIGRRDAILNEIAYLRSKTYNRVAGGASVNQPDSRSPLSVLASSLSEVSPGWSEFASGIDSKDTANRLRDMVYATIDPEKVDRFRRGPLYYLEHRRDGIFDLDDLNQQIDKEILNQYVHTLNKPMNMRLLDIYAQETGQKAPLEAYVKILESLLSFSSYPGTSGTTSIAPLTEFIYQNSKKYLGMTPGVYASRTNGKLSLQMGNMGLIEQFLESGLTDIPGIWLNAMSNLPMARVDLIDVLQDPDIAQYIDSILQGAGRAIDSYGSPMPFDLNVFRGVKMFAPAGNPMQYLEQIYAPGKLLAPQYISSSINPEVGLEFGRSSSLSVPVLENIKVEQGQKVWFPGIMGQGLQNEYEVTIPPTYQLRIKELVERVNPLYGMYEKPGGNIGPVFYEAIGELVPSTFKNFGKILTTAGLAGGSLAMMSAPDRAEAMSADTTEYKIQSYLQAVKNLNSFISTGETSRISDPYNAINPLNAPSVFKLTEMRIGDVIEYANQFADSFKNKNVTGAVGKYQNLPGLLEERAIRSGFNLDTIYTPEVQEKIAEQFLLKRWSGNGIGVEEYLQGKTSLNSIINRIAQIYRGMPGADGSYVGGGGNVTGTNMTKLNELKEYLIAAKMRYMPGFKKGGFVGGMPSMAIPAMLHGGEYVLNANAVQQLGLPYLNAMNQISQSRFTAPNSRVSAPVSPVTNNVSTVNIQVENFIGQEEWFNSMMKEYNVNVVPKHQKLAGLEQRKFTSYNGINQGM